MTTVALDAMGGDHAPKAVVQGALLAARDRSLEIVLVGRVGEVRPFLPAAPGNVHLHDAPDAVGMAESPVASVRQKPRSSIMVGLQLLQQREAAVFLSFGNTGAVMAASLLALGRIPGVARPALGAVFQNTRGARTLLLDIGANADCRPLYLGQFATMGKAYFERVLHHRHPSVGLLNVGEEEGKGNLFAIEAYRYLREHEPNFIGNVEGHALIAGAADVVVSDGFGGNVAVKVAEGVAELITTQLRRAIHSRRQYQAGAWLMRGAFDALRENMNYQRVGGAPLFGVNGAVIVGHGRADPEAVASGIRLARTVGQSTFVEVLRAEFAGTADAAPDPPPGVEGPQARARASGPSA